MSDIDTLIAKARVEGCDVCDGLANEITRLREELAASNADRDSWKRCSEDAHYRMILARRALAFGDNTPLKPIADEIASAATDAIERNAS